MAKRTHEPAFASAPGMEMLNRFVELLNTSDYWGASLIESRKKIGGDYRTIQKELRRLVQAWIRSGPNVSRLLDADPMLNQAIQSFRPHFIPTKCGVARLAFLNAPEYLASVKPIEIALGLFRDFLLNPYNDRLGGPCRNCGNYYVKKTERKKSVYCTKQCGHRFTSRLANKEQRNRERGALLELAKKRIATWLKAKTTMSWKVWVTQRPPITKHWLTRAVRKGELAEPKPI